MLGIIHLKHSQDRNALPGAGTFVSIASVMACPGQLILANAIVTERRHMTNA